MKQKSNGTFQKETYINFETERETLTAQYIGGNKYSIINTNKKQEQI